MGRKRRSAAVLGCSAVLFAGGVAWAGEGNQWLSAGGDLQNTRSQPSEHQISVDTVGGLVKKWEFTTGGDVSATPAVDANTVYFPDWAGNLYAVDKKTGVVRWQITIGSATGIPGDKARATPAVTGNAVIVGTQGALFSGGGPGGNVLAFDKNTGELLWKTKADDHFAAIITQSATVFDGKVFVGVASLEEALAGDPSYQCCSFRGSMLALDLKTGVILWKTYMAPAGYSGNAVWGSSPAIDHKRKSVYIATGNNYTVPDEVNQCVIAAAGDPVAVAACPAPDDYFDAIVSLDYRTGAVKWVTEAIPFDAWTTSCLPPPFGEGTNCPEPEGPDYDFGQAPALFKTKSATGKPIELVGAGQKSGQYWAVNPDTGAVVWVTEAGPGGTAGGLQWGSSVDGTHVYTANSNSNFKPWELPDGSTTSLGVWSALDAATGEIVWQRAETNPPGGIGIWGSTPGPTATANGVMFVCSMDALGHMYAFDGATGEILWSFASGGSCISGAAISNGMVFWGSGYSNFGGGTPNNKVFAFGL